MKKIFRNKLKLFFLIATVALFIACSDDDDYFDLTTLRSDFGMLHFNSQHQAVSFTNDSDETFQFTSYFQDSYYTADSTYRALVYYYPASTSPYYELYAFILVYVTEPVSKSTVGEMVTDPVSWENVWFSENSSYLNFTFGVKYDSSDTSQILYFVKDIDEDNGRTRLTLYHDQNGVAEYYTSDLYVSIPLKGNFESGESIEIVVNDYDNDIMTRNYTIPYLYAGASELY